MQPLCVQKNVGMLCYSTLLHGLLADKFASPADIPDGRARTRHFSKNRSDTRHAEEGCETEIFTAIEKIREIANELQTPMQLVAVSWVLQQPGVATVILGARKPEQIQQMAAVIDFKLTPETIQQLTEVSEPSQTNPRTQSRYVDV